jgi:hypothetical protein
MGESIDDQEIDGLAEAGNHGFECRQFLGLGRVQLGALGALESTMDRCFEFNSVMFCRDPPIFDVMCEALLIYCRDR